jgi:hypothetical protein
MARTQRSRDYKPNFDSMDQTEKDTSGDCRCPECRETYYPDSTSDLSDDLWISWKGRTQRRFKDALLYGALDEPQKT